MKRNLDAYDPEHGEGTAKVMPGGGRFGMKFLFSAMELDAMSNKLSEIRQETGAILVANTKYYPGTELQELSISGSNTEVVMAALLQAQTVVLNELGSLTNDEPNVEQGEGRLKAVVPTKAAAGMIGRGGENIKHMRAQTGIHVHIDQQAIPPGGGELAEQVVAFSGELTGLQAAVPLLAEHVAAVAGEPWFVAWASTSNAGLEVPGLWLELTGKGAGKGKGKAKGPGPSMNGFRPPMHTPGPGGQDARNALEHQGEMCQFFAKSGWCKWGDACKHSHGAGHFSRSSFAPAIDAFQSYPPPYATALPPQSGEMCQFFVKAGWCKYGDACKHSHGGYSPESSGLGGGPQTGEMCQFFAKAGWCKYGDACKHSHGVGSFAVSGFQQPVHQAPIQETGEPCLFFAKSGWCKYGDACRHSHHQSDVNIARAVSGGMPVMTSSSGEICQFFAKAGWCKHGDACRHVHEGGPRAAPPQVSYARPPPMQTGEMCEFFMKAGWCKYGDACRHSHAGGFAGPPRHAGGFAGPPPEGRSLAPPESSGEPCQFFAKAGWCKYGDACRHYHDAGPGPDEGQHHLS